MAFDRSSLSRAKYNQSYRLGGNKTLRIIQSSSTCTQLSVLYDSASSHRCAARFRSLCNTASISGARKSTRWKPDGSNNLRTRIHLGLGARVHDNSIDFSRIIPCVL
uniref:Uncharacterized protein n=1 Tax=Trichogramma kaykai TaxID=54128 RepID=A0ABD2X5K1_9HYME